MQKDIEELKKKKNEGISVGGILKTAIVIIVFVAFVWLVGQYKIEKGEGVILTKLDVTKLQ